MAGIQAGGIGSGLDINNLVTQLVAAEGQVRENRMNRQEAVAQGELSAIGSLKGTLADFKNAITVLCTASQLGGRIANNSSNDEFSVSVNEFAPISSYAVEVQTLAVAQKVASSGFASNATVVGTGTLTFQFGTYDSTANTFTLNPDTNTQTLQISPANSTVQGIRDAVNKANVGVTASIIYNGTTDCLVFSSTALGASNSMKITVTDDDGNNTDTSGLSQLAFDPTAGVGNGKNLTQTQAGVDAHLVIDGIDVYEQSNTITDAIEGVTLNLKSAAIGTITTTTVSLHTGNAQSKVANFVKAYNTMITTLKGMTSYDPETKKSGPLNGDPTARGLQTEILHIISSVVSGLDGKYRALADVGITTSKDGTLTIDNTILNAAIADDFEALGQLFAPAATVDDDQISFVHYTKESQIGDYAINITQLATTGQEVGSDPANLTITAGVNDTLVIQLDGQTASITLTAGVYTPDTLAAQLQSIVNGTSPFNENDLSMTVTQNAGILTIQSNQYGSQSQAEIIGGNGAGDLLGATPTATLGLDVAGTFNEIPGTGSGQTLIGTGFASGIQLDVIGGALGSRGNVNFTRGVADKLNDALEQYLGPDNVLSSRTKMLNTRLKDIGYQREIAQQRLQAFKTRLVAQFTALDKLVSTLRNTSEFLRGQLANLPGPRR